MAQQPTAGPTTATATAQGTFGPPVWTLSACCSVAWAAACSVALCALIDQATGRVLWQRWRWGHSPSHQPVFFSLVSNLLVRGIGGMDQGASNSEALSSLPCRIFPHFRVSHSPFSQWWRVEVNPFWVEMPRFLKYFVL